MFMSREREVSILALECEKEDWSEFTPSQADILSIVEMPSRTPLAGLTSSGAL